MTLREATVHDLNYSPRYKLQPLKTLTLFSFSSHLSLSLTLSLSLLLVLCPPELAAARLRGSRDLIRFLLVMFFTAFVKGCCCHFNWSYKLNAGQAAIHTHTLALAPRHTHITLPHTPAYSSNEQRNCKR